MLVGEEEIQDVELQSMDKEGFEKEDNSPILKSRFIYLRYYSFHKNKRIIILPILHCWFGIMVDCKWCVASGN
jgi:hypothetical protein